MSTLIDTREGAELLGAWSEGETDAERKMFVGEMLGIQFLRGFTGSLRFLRPDDPNQFDFPIE